MSTSSTYSSNKLKQILEHRTQHFIIRSYLTTKFEYERKEPEYFLYWFNINSGIDSELMKYKFLSYKKMNKKEVRLFYDILTSYVCAIESKDGNVWHHKDIGFDKEKVKINQLSFNL